MKRPARSARNLSSRRNCFCAATRRAICSCAPISLTPISPRSRKRPKASAPIPLCVGYVDQNSERPGRALRNSAAVLQNGKIVWRTHKCLLPTYDVFDEDRYFEPAKSIAPFEFNGHKLGITICEDIWNDEDFWPERLYRRDPVKELIAQGAEVILNISASPWHDGKEKMRLDMLQRVARDEGVPLAQVNLVGANDELIFDGHSVALDRARRSRRARARVSPRMFWWRIWNRQEPVTARTIESEIRDVGVDFPRASSNCSPRCRWASGITSTNAASNRPLSACPAALIRRWSPCWRRTRWARTKCVGVSMPARYSSEGSLSDAEALAKNLGIRYEVLPIEPVFQSVEKQLAKVFAGTKPNEAEENVQSRLRGVTLMALSNKFGALVLTTGNKSEMAVGYCTLYGDMCGALAAIADVFKTDVYKIARWVNREREIIPAASITKPPSAELRPNQTDQDSLPPYEMLDQILDAYVVQNLSKAEIIARGFDAAVVNDVINKITFSEYKRRQAAPGLKVSPRAFGIGRRIPIAQKFRATL